VAAVERALKTVPGVTYVSAGWWSNTAVISTAAGIEVPLEILDQALQGEGFRALGLKPLQR
jgi:hypothetical protein